MFEKVFCAFFSVAATVLVTVLGLTIAQGLQEKSSPPLQTVYVYGKDAVQLGFTEEKHQCGVFIRREGDVVLWLSAHGLRARRDSEGQEEIFNLTIEDLRTLDRMLESDIFKP